MTTLKVHVFQLNNGLFRRLSLLLAVLLLMLGLHPGARALAPLDPYAGAELSVTFAYSGTPLPGARFSLYRVGDVDADAGITLLQPFSDSFAIKHAGSARQWDQLAADMVKLCKEKAVEPLTSGQTGQNGRVSFGEDRELACGLYLVVGEDLVYQDVKYTSLPFLVLLPSWNAESASWDYAVFAAPKLGRETLPPDPPITPTPGPPITPTPGPDITPTPRPDITPTPRPVITPTPGPIWWPTPTPYPNYSNTGTVYPQTLPQTGLLWWPVPPLLLCGVGLIAVGFLRRRKCAEESGHSGRLTMLAGACCVAVSLSLFMHNMWADARAGIHAAEEKEALIAAVLPETIEWSGFVYPELREPEPRQSAADPYTDTDTDTDTSTDTVKPKRYINMPVKMIDGVNYVAMLSIPDLELELPIRDSWDMEGLKYSPARFTGSAYMSDLVICAHNFSQHFGRLKDLEPGNEILLVDMNGNLFRYQVEKTETLQPEDVEEMTQSEYDLSLFTCTLGGATRVTVRCRQIGAQTASMRGLNDQRVKS